MTRAALCLCTLCALAACDASLGTGTAQIFVAAEDTIPDGLQAGTGEENIQDGWTVTYDRFLITIGNFRAARTTSSTDKLSNTATYVIDMKALPSDGFVLATFSDAAATRWDRVGFDLPNTGSSTLRADVTSEADFAMMQSTGNSIYVEATISKTGGQSCKPTAPTDCVPREAHRLVFGLKAGTAFDDCAPPSGDAGFAIPTGGTVQVKPTIHGDHWFFNNVTQGAETTDRLAQWIVDSDLDRDGVTTTDELKQVTASDVFLPGKGYNLSGAIIPINTAFDYLEAQVRTLGDFQGEGECPTRAKL